ncbi:YdgA family protein [Rouxiella sp. Mn2063]|uniref:YdgA family protein n=1 Tax=Rouxiella sp. Mn2063 TaxID=3395262 RepID=UPI003BBF3BC2
MKKSLVAVSVIVVLGAAWTGVSWYTGKQLESHMSEIVNDANANIKQSYPKSGVSLSYEDYQRGIFSSSVRLVLQQAAGAGNAAELKAGEKIVFLETIDHGPFPTSQLKKLTLIPSMASIHSELENTPPVKELFDATKGKSFITADTRVSYSGDTASAITLLPVDYQKNNSKLEFSGAKLDIDLGKDVKKVDVDANSDSVAFTSPNQWGQLEKVVLSGITIKSNTNGGKFNLGGIGSQSLAVKNAAVNIDGKDTATLAGFALNSKFDEDGNNVNGVLNYTMDSLKIQGMDFGAGKLNVKIDKLDGQALKQFTDTYNQQAMQLLQQSDELDPQVYQQQASALLLNNLPILLKGNPSISVDPLSWKNDKGESTFTLQVGFKDPTASPQATDEAQLVSNLLSKVDAKLTIPVAMATELTTQAGRLQGYDAEQAGALAKQQVQGLAAMGEMFKLTTLKDDAISSELHYADNQINLNGQKMTLQDFVGLFGIFGGPGAADQSAPAPQVEAPSAQ